MQHLAASVADPIIIGIVNPDPVEPWVGDGDWVRFMRHENVLTYWERLTLVSIVLEQRELANQIEAIVPSPRPSVNLDRANRFLPPQPRTMVLCVRWGDEVEEWKAEKYRQNGEQVHIIPADELGPVSRLASGAKIRELVIKGRQSWRLLVPEETLPLLDEFEFERRVRDESADLGTSLSGGPVDETDDEVDDVLESADAELRGQEISSEDMRARIAGRLASAGSGLGAAFTERERVELERLVEEVGEDSAGIAFERMPGGLYKAAVEPRLLGKLGGRPGRETFVPSTSAVREERRGGDVDLWEFLAKAEGAIPDFDAALVERALASTGLLTADGLKLLIGVRKPRGPRQRGDVFGTPTDAEWAFVRTFPALGPSTDDDVRLERLVALVYRRALDHAMRDGKWLGEPSDWRKLAWYCLLRLEPLDADSADEDLRLQLYKTAPFRDLGGRRVRGYTYRELRDMDADALEEALPARLTADPERNKALRVGALNALPLLLKRWNEQLLAARRKES
jgi:hypothetical protein